MTDQIEEMRGFLDRYRSFTDTFVAKEQKDFRSNFERLRSELEPIEKEVAAAGKAYAPNFNIFRLLNPKEHEKAHSDFLAELLRPEGSHGQQSLFLRTFLELCEKQNPALPKLSTQIIQSPRVWVKREHSIRHGQLDILIRSTSPKFIIVIENKIKAGDQRNQLERYSVWLKSELWCPDSRKVLVYLAAREAQRNAAKERKIDTC